MISVQSSTNPESLSGFGRGHYQRGSVMVESTHIRPGSFNPGGGGGVVFSDVIYRMSIILSRLYQRSQSNTAMIGQSCSAFTFFAYYLRNVSSLFLFSFL